MLIYHLFYHKKIKEKSLNDFLNLNDQGNSVLISLYETYHLECLPGLIYYFIILKYKVDILMNYKSIESIEKLNPTKYIRVFQYKNYGEINYNLKLFKNSIAKYKFLFLLL